MEKGSCKSYLINWKFEIKVKSCAYFRGKVINNEKIKTKHLNKTQINIRHHITLET